MHCSSPVCNFIAFSGSDQWVQAMKMMDENCWLSFSKTKEFQYSARPGHKKKHSPPVLVTNYLPTPQPAASPAVYCGPCSHFVLAELDGTVLCHSTVQAPPPHSPAMRISVFLLLAAAAIGCVFADEPSTPPVLRFQLYPTEDDCQSDTNLFSTLFTVGNGNCQYSRDTKENADRPVLARPPEDPAATHDLEVQFCAYPGGCGACDTAFVSHICCSRCSRC